MNNNETNHLGENCLSPSLLDNGKSQACEFMASLPHDRFTITVDELASVLGVSRPTAYGLANRKDFPSFKIGKRILIDKSALPGWISDQTSKKKG